MISRVKILVNKSDYDTTYPSEVLNPMISSSENRSGYIIFDAMIGANATFVCCIVLRCEDELCNALASEKTYTREAFALNLLSSRCAHSMSIDLPTPDEPHTTTIGQLPPSSSSTNSRSCESSARVARHCVRVSMKMASDGELSHAMMSITSSLCSSGSPPGPRPRCRRAPASRVHCRCPLG